MPESTDPRGATDHRWIQATGGEVRARAAPGRMSRSSSDHPAVLLVDDDPVLCTFLGDNLAADGYELVLAETARDGLRQLEYKRLDLAIVDLGLPDGSGLDLIARVRGADGLVSRLDPALPLVVLSGRAGELDRLRAFERGADDFMAKGLA